MNEHGRIEEMMAARSLGGLDPADTEELERARSSHGSECAECRRLETEYEEVAGKLAFALTPAELPEGFEDRVIEQAVRPRRHGFGGLGLRQMAMVGAAVVLLVAGAIGGYVAAPRGNEGLTAAVGFVSHPDTKLVSLDGSGSGNLSVAFRPGEDLAYVIASDLPSVPEGKVYELWLMKAGVPSPATVFPGGKGPITKGFALDPSTADQLAVTVEDAPGVGQPTQSPRYIASVNA
jgi:Anti-sigma-K factor rskA